MAEELGDKSPEQIALLALEYLERMTRAVEALAETVRALTTYLGEGARAIRVREVERR